MGDHTSSPGINKVIGVGLANRGDPSYLPRTLPWVSVEMKTIAHYL